MWGLFAVLVLMAVISFYRSRRRRFSLFKELGVPGPSPSLIFGNMTELIKKGTLATFDHWISKYGDVVGFYNGATQVLIVRDLDLIKKIEIQDFSNFRDRGVMSNYVKTQHLTKRTISSTPGDAWKFQRKAVIRAFTPSKLKKIATHVSLCCEEFMGVLESLEVKEEAFEVGRVFHELSTDVTVRCLFGDQAHRQLNQGGFGTEVLNGTLRTFLDSLDSDWLVNIIDCFPEFPYLWSFVLALRSRFLKSSVDKIEEAIAPIVRERRSNPKVDQDNLLQLMLMAEIGDNSLAQSRLFEAEGGKDNSQPSDIGISKTPRHLFTDEEIHANILSILIDGFESIGTAMTFMAYLLAKHQDVQDRLRSEMVALLEQTEESYPHEVLKNEYMDQVTSETLRCYPPVVSFITRTCAEDYDYNGLKIPGGMIILIPVYQLNHDPNLWNQPEKFDPERFSASNKSSMNPMMYQTFGNGPRGCMGMRFAQLVLKITFAKILVNYRLILDKRHVEDDRLKLKTAAIFASPEDGVWIKLRKLSS